jgi:hypothetical protein
MDAIESTRNAAERVMATAVGSVRLDVDEALDSSDRSALVRFRVADGPTGAPASIIVKRAVDLGTAEDDPSDPDSPTIRFHNEWASLRLLSELTANQPVAPRLYGANPVTGILVMEDLGPVNRLAESLLGNDSHAALADLTAYATTVGRLHAVTAPHVERFQQLRDSLGPPHPGFGEAWIAPAFHAMLGMVGVPSTPTIDRDLGSLAASIARPGEFATLIHADPCPDNWTRVADGDRLLDFEFSRIGHALMDGVYGKVPFPTCWCVGTLPERVAQDMTDAYRTELARGCPAALDNDRYARAEAEACVFWLILLCHLNSLTEMIDEDWRWGTAGIRQRLLTRLEVVAEVTTEAGHLPAIGEAAGAMARELHRRWDGEVEQMPLYPAFRS